MRKRVRRASGAPTYRRVKRTRTGSAPMAMRVRRKYTGPSRNMHHFRRYVAGESILFNNPTTSGAITFALSQVDNVSEFVNLYDQFKLTRVVVKFSLVNNPSASNSYAPGANSGAVYSTNFYPKLWYYRDYDDSSTVDLAGIRQVGKAKCFTLLPNKEYSVAIKPAKLNQLYSSPVTTSYAPDWKSRLDMANNTTPHYGLKYVIDNNGVTSITSFTMRINYLYYFTCYNTR